MAQHCVVELETMLEFSKHFTIALDVHQGDLHDTVRQRGKSCQARDEAACLRRKCCFRSALSSVKARFCASQPRHGRTQR